MDLEEMEMNSTNMAMLPDLIPVSLTYSINDTNTTWTIFGELGDAIFLPALFTLVGLIGICGNGLLLYVIICYQYMHSGVNFMLLNIAVSDLVFIALCIPITLINHISYGQTQGPLSIDICKLVHYVIFVTVYVGIYTLVVLCIFRFFAVYFPRKFSSILSRRIALVFNLLIWFTILLSHINFFVQDSDVIFQEAFICALTEILMDHTKIRTLWVTFLTFAFLLPLLAICTLSAIILHLLHKERSKVKKYSDVQEEIYHKRELTMLIMATMVARTVCWLPIQIFVLFDIFQVVDLTETYQKIEILCVCMAFTCPGITPIIYSVTSTDFRTAFQEALSCLPCCKKGREEEGSDMNETIMSIISDSSNCINYT